MIYFLFPAVGFMASPVVSLTSRVGSRVNSEQNPALPRSGAYVQECDATTAEKDIELVTKKIKYLLQ